MILCVCVYLCVCLLCVHFVYVVSMCVVCVSIQGSAQGGDEDPEEEGV